MLEENIVAGTIVVLSLGALAGIIRLLKQLDEEGQLTLVSPSRAPQSMPAAQRSPEAGRLAPLPRGDALT